MPGQHLLVLTFANVQRENSPARATKMLRDVIAVQIRPLRFIGQSRLLKSVWSASSCCQLLTSMCFLTNETSTSRYLYPQLVLADLVQLEAYLKN